METEILIKNKPSTASYVTNNMWIGSAPFIKADLRGFDCLILAAREYQPDSACFSSGISVIHTPMRDIGIPMTKEEMRSSIQTAKKVVRIVSENKVILSTCYQGLNRSSLIIALALILGNPGTSADEAVQLIRSARGSMALSNPYFVRFIYDVEKSLFKNLDTLSPR